MLGFGLFVDPATIGQFAWTLLHFSWQGLVLAAFLWFALKIPRQSPLNRYIAACITLLLMAAAPLVTYWSMQGRFDDPGPLQLPQELVVLQRPPSPWDVPAAEVVPSGEGVTPPTVRSKPPAETYKWSLPSSWAHWAQTGLPWIVLAWLLLALALVLRQGISVVLLRRMLRQNSVSLRDGFASLKELPQRMGIRRRVEFRECPLLEVPATVGSLKPLVLVPADALDSLPEEQLKALVAHELAHIRRHDYVINLVQLLLETLLAFHPITWWVSSRVREERESCCDEVASDALGSRKTYAQALQTMEKLRPRIAANIALSAAGGPLLRRIQRLATQENKKTSRAARIVLLVPLVITGMLFVVAGQLVATGVNVEPVRGLGDVVSVSGGIYRTLQVPSAGGDFLAALRQVASTASSDGKHFDPAAVEDFVYHANRDPRASALLEAALPLVTLEERTSFEKNPNWKYGSAYVRTRLRKELVDEANRLLQRHQPDRAREYARACLLFAAQEAGLNGTMYIGRCMKDDILLRCAQLTPRQEVRINRVVDDHRIILSVCSPETSRALQALRSLDASRKNPSSYTPAPITNARQSLNDAIVNLLRLSRGRPDIQWTAANLCWRAHAVLTEGRDAHDHWQQDLLLRAGNVVGDAKEVSYLRRWLDDALHEPAPLTIPEGPEKAKRQAAQWEKDGLIERRPLPAPGTPKGKLPPARFK